MTYDELLRQTAEEKKKVLSSFNEAMKGPAGFLVKAEIERNPGGVAWHYLAKEFCETLSDHIEEFIEQEGTNNPTAYEITDIYMAYQDDRADELYDLLPDEARLFD